MANEVNGLREVAFEGRDGVDLALGMGISRLSISAFLMLLVTVPLGGLTVERLAPDVREEPDLRLEYGEALEVLWSGGEKGIGAVLSAGADAKGLQVRVEVRDPVHANDYESKFLFRGDCLYLGFDGLGNSSMKAAETEADDGSVFMALGPDGPVGRVMRHGDAAKRQALPPEQFQIKRDEEAQVTTYEMSLPWELLGSGPGISSGFGIGVNVAHKNADGEDLLWGTLLTRGEEKRRLNTVTLTGPDDPVEFASGIARLLLPGSESRSRFVMAHSGDGIARIEVRDRKGDVLVSETWEGVTGETIRGEVVFKQSDISRWGREFSVHLFRGSKEELVNRLEFVTLEEPITELLGSISTALDGGDVQPLARIHLESLRALILELSSHAPLSTDMAWQERALATVEAFREQFASGAFDFRTHLANGLPLLFAYLADYDGSLQFSTLQLPPDWDPERAYPFVVYLHGAGPRTPLDFLVTAVDNSGQDTLWREGEGIGPEEGQRRCVLLAPYARGTQGYIGPAAQDVLQAMERLEESVKIDPDHRYITGFSMGCNGAWYLAHLRPDLWAGVNLAAGFGYWSFTHSPDHQQGRGLPVAIWCGEADHHMFDGAQSFAESVKEDEDHVVRFVPDTPHTYPYAEYGKMLSWLFKYKRAPVPSQFEYVSEGSHYGGRNGIWMYGPSSYRDDEGARFSVSIETNKIVLDTEYATGVRIEPRELGFEPGDFLEIVWNGESVHSGSLESGEELVFGEFSNHTRSRQYGALLR